MTLVELVVALTLLAIAASLVVPALLTPTTEQGGTGLQSVVSQTRALAIARAQTLELLVAKDGSYSVRTLSPGSILLGGNLGTTANATRILITPLGACLVKAADAAAPRLVDSSRCTFTAAGADS